MHPSKFKIALKVKVFYFSFESHKNLSAVGIEYSLRNRSVFLTNAHIWCTEFGSLAERKKLLNIVVLEESIDSLTQNGSDNPDYK